MAKRESLPIAESALQPLQPMKTLCPAGGEGCALLQGPETVGMGGCLQKPAPTPAWPGWLCSLFSPCSCLRLLKTKQNTQNTSGQKAASARSLLQKGMVRRTVWVKPLQPQAVGVLQRMERPYDLRVQRVRTGPLPNGLSHLPVCLSDSESLTRFISQPVSSESLQGSEHELNQLSVGGAAY